MKVNYNSLWKTLIDKKMNKKDLQDLVGISPATIAKMGKCEFVSMGVLCRIAVHLGIDIGDIVKLDRGEVEN